MEEKHRLRPILRMLLKWPVCMTALLVVMNIYLYFVDLQAGVVCSCFVGVYALVLFVVYLYNIKKLKGELVRFGVNYGQVQRKMITELAIPYATLDTEGNILWANKRFVKLAGGPVSSGQNISIIFPEINKNSLPQASETSEFEMRLGGPSEGVYRVEMKRLVIDSFNDEAAAENPMDKCSNTLITVYLYDETEIMRIRKELDDSEMIVGLLYIDNYDEVLESIDDVRRSLLIALVDRKVNKFFQNYDTVIKKIEKDKYIFILQNQYLDQLKDSKFQVLDDVRTVNIGNEIAVTVSIGIGVHFETYTRAYEAARAAMDLALGRGGDQAVIKAPDSVQYFGAKSGSVEKNSKVKSRVKAHALRELIEGKDKVLVMGHAVSDVDSFGSAVGVYRIATSMNKETHIVLSDVSGSMKTMVERFTSAPEYSSMIITPEQALDMMDSMTLVVLVDVNRPSRTECPALLDKSKATVVLDHHRQAGDAVENASLSYIETSASSACEIVAEILQYIGDDIRLKAVEADAMFAGIVIDSNNFTNKTGIRTFEAAAFLRRNGADITRVRKIFRSDLNESLIKARAVAATKMYLQNYAFTICDAKGVESPTVLGAQVANELMDISNIKASFVFTEYNDMIYVSARSIDEVNVQVIMEKLGGGGHMSVAGAQFADCDIEEAMERVKAVLREMNEGGEI